MPYHGMGTLSRQGDPGFFGSVFRGIKGAVGGFVGGGPLGAIRGGISGLVGGGGSPGRQTPGSRLITSRARGLARPGGQVPVPGFRGAVQRFIPGGATGFQDTFGPPKRKRMNPANPKALRRAIRRQSGFVKLARRALKGSGFKIVSGGSRPRRDIAPGHGHVR